MNLAEIFCARAKEHPEAIALIDGPAGRKRTTTYVDLDAASQRLAANLDRAGLQPGDRVLVLQPMSAELYTALLAIFRRGLVAMFVDPAAGIPHLEECCRLADPRAFLAMPRAHLLRLLSPAIRRIPIKWSIGPTLPGAPSWQPARRLAPCPTIHACEPDTPALLTFTSGSTGSPKAIMRSHGFLMAQYSVLQTTLDLQPGAMDLTTMPIFALVNLASGVKSLIPDADLRFPGSIAPARMAAEIRRYQPVTTVASPALLGRLANHVMTQGPPLASFRSIYTGGAPVFPRLISKIRSAAPSARIGVIYGSSEAEPIAKRQIDEVDREDRAALDEGKGLLVGRPVPDIRLRIIRDRWGIPIGPFRDAQFEIDCLPANQPGEIVVNGPHVLPGYWRQMGDTEFKFQVGNEVWHRTGDAGYLDEQGRLWILGRCSTVIRDGQGTLFPLAVETAADHFSEVRRSALIAIAGKRTLMVELADSATHSPTISALRQHLEWAHLHEIRIIRKIPVDSRHNAKVDYPALTRLIAPPDQSDTVLTRACRKRFSGT